MSQDKLDPRLQASLESLGYVPERDPQAAARGRANFLAKAASLKTSVSTGPFLRLNNWIVSLPRFTQIHKKERFSMLTALTSFIVAIVIALGGTGAVVYAAQDSIPADFLYPVKTFTEDLQLDLSSDAQDQLSLLEDFTERRFEEMSALALAGEPIPTETAARLQQQMDSMLQLAAGMGDEALNQVLTQMKVALQQHEQTMAMMGNQTPAQTDPMLTQIQQMLQAQQRLVETGLTEPNTFRQHMNSMGNGPAEYPSQTPMPGGGYGPGDGTPIGTGVGSGSGGENDLGSGNGPGDGTPQPTCIGTPIGTGGSGGENGPGSGNGPGDGTPQPTCIGTPIGTGVGNGSGGENDPGSGNGPGDDGGGGGQGGKP
ncbi:MAG: DUF5667 domain-containing protein [Chloroflexota bacterium]